MIQFTARALVQRYDIIIATTSYRVAPAGAREAVNGCAGRLRFDNVRRAG
jgi:hypothetical protein